MNERPDPDGTGRRSAFENVVSMEMDRDGFTTVKLTDGTEHSSHLDTRCSRPPVRSLIEVLAALRAQSPATWGTSAHAASMASRSAAGAQRVASQVVV